LGAEQFTLTPLQEYWAVVTSQVVGDSKVGNHLGSVDLGVDYQFNGFTLKAYRQNIYDIDAIVHLANLKDGLNGLTIVNTRPAAKRGLHWKTILLEVLYTKSQAGEIGKDLISGAEDYYGNYQYPQGWTYRRNNLGSPFITSRLYIKENLSRLTPRYFVNNRVQVFHVAVEGRLNDISFSTKVSYSKNYGGYETSGRPYRGVNNDIQYPSEKMRFNLQNQLSTYIECHKEFMHDVKAGLMLAIDTGDLLHNSQGLQAHISKSF
jgi:hypothetical protein